MCGFVKNLRNKVLFSRLTCFNDMFKEAGNSEWANATNLWSDGGKVFAAIYFGVKITFDDAFFAGSASIYKSGVGFYHIIFD